MPVHLWPAEPESTQPSANCRSAGRLVPGLRVWNLDVLPPGIGRAHVELAGAGDKEALSDSSRVSGAGTGALSRLGPFATAEASVCPLAPIYGALVGAWVGSCLKFRAGGVARGGDDTQLPAFMAKMPTELSRSLADRSLPCAFPAQRNPGGRDNAVWPFAALGPTVRLSGHCVTTGSLNELGSHFGTFRRRKKWGFLLLQLCAIEVSPVNAPAIHTESSCIVRVGLRGSPRYPQGTAMVDQSCLTSKSN